MRKLRVRDQVEFEGHIWTVARLDRERAYLERPGYQPRVTVMRFLLEAPISEIVHLSLGDFVTGDYRHTSAVYFLNLNGEIVYVGQSRRLRSRIGNHISDGTKKFDSISFIRIPAEQLLVFEAYYINKLQPQYNQTLKYAKI